MNILLKKFLAIIVLLLILFNLAGCINNVGVEELAYVIAIGLDALNDNNIELTLQFATAGSGDSSGSSMQSTKINVSSVKCATIDSGMTLINSHISKKINLSHCKEIVISEELAKQGIERYLDTLINNTELTNDAEIIISKCSAKEYIESVNPVFEGLLSEYYTATLKTNTYTAYATNMNLATFYCLLKDSCYQPYATIGNVSSSTDKKQNKISTDNKESNNSSDNTESESTSDNSGGNIKNSSGSSSENADEKSGSSSSDNTKSLESENEEVAEPSKQQNVPIESSINANFIAGDYEIDDKNPIQIIGFAAFNQDKLVGEFTGLDSICFLMINNEFEESIISIPSPFEDGHFIDLSVTSNKKTKCSVDLNGTSPKIYVTVYLTGFGQSLDEKTSYSDEESVSKIKQSAENYIKENIQNFLYKTSKEYSSDICGFGRFAVKHYLTMEEWNNANWLDDYKNATFDVNVSFNIKAGNIFSET